LDGIRLGGTLSNIVKVMKLRGNRASGCGMDYTCTMMGLVTGACEKGNGSHLHQNAGSTRLGD